MCDIRIDAQSKFADVATAGINIKDEMFGIDWRIPADKAILSEKDLRHANLLDGPLDFDFNDNLYPEFSK